MSRTIFPVGVNSQVTLLEDIIAKHGAMGANSPIILFLDNKGIDLNADTDTGITALAHNKQFLTLTKSSQDLYQGRDLLIGPVMAHLKGGYQVLKTLYSPNFKALGDWGAIVSNSGKITYPTDTASKAAMYALMAEKSNDYPTDTSPLTAYLEGNNISLSDDSANADEAVGMQSDSVAAALKAENYRQLRDLVWAPVLQNLHDIAAFLKKLYKSNPKTLGLWGFVVDSSPKKEKLRQLVVKAGGTKLKIKLKIGSTIKNTGGTDMYLYKGKTIAGTPILILAGNSYLITKGYGFTSIQNTSSSADGKITLLPVKF